MTAGRLLGVDYGDVRVGLAVSDPGRKIAFPLAVYTRRGREHDAASDVTAPTKFTPGMEEALKILVVDDESALRETLKRSFTLEGHRVTAVADGSSAIDRR